MAEGNPGGREVGRLSIKVLPNTSEFRDRLRDFIASVEHRMTVNLPVEPNMREFRTRLRTELREIQARSELNVPIHADRNALGSVGRDIERVSRAANNSSGLDRFAQRLRNLSTAVPVAGLASLSPSLVHIAPAAAIAAPALLSVASAGAAVAVGMHGMSDALSGDSKALKKLAPSAQEAVKSIRGLAPEWRKLQSTVQQHLFDGLGKQITSVAKTALPVLQRGLTQAADVMNAFGKSFLGTIQQVSKSGLLDKAFKAGSKGLENLKTIPGDILRSFLDLTVAAGPLWDRFTQGLANGFTKIRQALDRALGSGALTRIINNAGNLIANVVKVAGTGISVLLQLFGSIADAVGPALQDAFTAISPVIIGLAKVIGTALTPVLKTMANFFANTILPVASQLVDVLGQLLTPVIAGLGVVVGTAADSLSKFLAPILRALPDLVRPLIEPFKSIMNNLTLIANVAIKTLNPSLSSMGTSFGNLVTAIGPLVGGLLQAVAGLLIALTPVITQVLAWLGKLNSVLVNQLAMFINTVVIPAIHALTALLNGDFSSAAKFAGQAISGMQLLVEGALLAIIIAFNNMKNRALNYLAGLVVQAQLYIQRMGTGIVLSAQQKMAEFVIAVNNGINHALSYLRGLPGQAASAVGNLSGVLVRAGASLIAGFINGIVSKIGDVRSTLGGLTNSLSSWKGPETLDKRLLTPAGQYVIGGFIKGLNNAIPDVRRQLQGFTADIPAMVGNVSVIGQSAAPAIAPGLQPGDRIALDVDGQTTLYAYIKRGADDQISQSLGVPAGLGRR